MKTLLLLVVVTLTQGFVVEHSRTKREAKIPAPKISSLVSKDNSFEVQWKPVKADKDVIVGYKVRVWELKPKVVIAYSTNSAGEKELVEKDEEPTINSPSPKDEPSRIIEVKGADSSSAIVDQIKAHVIYEVRVVAYTKDSEGPESTASRIQIG